MECICETKDNYTIQSVKYIIQSEKSRKNV